MGAIHSTKISGNFGPKLNGSVRSNRKSFEKTGPPFEVDHFSRSDRLEFWFDRAAPSVAIAVCVTFEQRIRPSQNISSLEILILQGNLNIAGFNLKSKSSKKFQLCLNP